MSIVLDSTRIQGFAEQALGIVKRGFLSLMLRGSSYRIARYAGSRSQEWKEIS